MKRFLLIPSCALLALSVLTSCQKEEKSALELTKDLTAELQKVTDYRTAEAAAPRVEALNKRLQDALVRTVSLGKTPLLRSENGDGGRTFAAATVELAKELGRVRSSVPVATADGEVDREKLIMATGVAAGVEPGASPSARKAAGQKFIMHDADKSHEAPPEFVECYGSTSLKAALSYTAERPSFMAQLFGSPDVPAIPEPVAVAEEEPAADEPAADEPAADEPSADTEEPASTEEDTSSSEEPAADDDSSSDDLGIDISSGDDEPASSDDEPAADDSSDEPSDEDDADLGIDISMDDL